MAQTAGYPAHPPHFSGYEYHLPRTPQTSRGGVYYSPRQVSYSSTPMKGHARRATGDGTTYTYTTTAYSTPRKPTCFSPAEFSSPGYYGSAQSTPIRKTNDYVSDSAPKREPTRSRRVPAREDGKKQRKYSNSKHYSSRSRVVLDDPSDHEYEYLPRYEQYEARPPPYWRSQSYNEPGADRRYSNQVPIYAPAESDKKPRQRRASYATKPAQPIPLRRPSATTKSPPKATEADARDAGIPAGYSFKNWDPTEEPILLLGSVFDANSLGKWIYDWTVYFYGAATPMSEVAGELWLLLIQLAGKIKRAEECWSRIRQVGSRDLVDEFLKAGERLWKRFTRLLKVCENYMWKAAKRECGKSEKVTMGRNSGCEFVDSIFGRDRELEETERLMTGMRLWSMRFDANCEDILRNPSA